VGGNVDSDSKESDDEQTCLTLLKETIFDLVSEDACIAQTLSCLCDGNDDQKFSLRTEDLLLSLSTTVLPLLGAEWIFTPACEKINFTRKQIDDIVDTHCHKEDNSVAANLYPVLSSIPHTTNTTANTKIICPLFYPETAKLKQHGAVVVIAARHIAVGEELFCCG